MFDDLEVDMSLCSLSDSDEILPASKKRPRPATLAEEASPRPPPLRKGPPPSFPPSDGILALTDSSSDDESVVKKDAFTLAESSSDEEPPVEVQQGAPPSPSPPLYQVAYCKCSKPRRSRVCCKSTSCPCLSASIQCGQGCGCENICANGSIGNADEKLYIGPSNIKLAGRGCFARFALARGELVGEYRGEILSNVMAESREKTRGRRLDYLANLDSPGGIVIDVEFSGSKVTRINHPGHSKRPNVIAVKKQVRVENNSRLSRSIFIKATKSISAGEELFWHYDPNYPTSNFA